MAGFLRNGKNVYEFSNNLCREVKAKIGISKVDSKKHAINLGERERPVKLGAKYNGKNPQGRPIGHTTETATKDKILIACNPDFSHSTCSATPSTHSTTHLGHKLPPSLKLRRAGRASANSGLQLTQVRLCSGQVSRE